MLESRWGLLGAERDVGILQFLYERKYGSEDCKRSKNQVQRLLSNLRSFHL